MTTHEMHYMRDQLPAVMAADEGLREFLAPLDQIAGELYEYTAAKELLFDLTVAPLAMVRFLGAQIGVDIDADLSGTVQRRIARTAARTFPRRGTKDSIEQNLQALTGTSVRVVDDGWIALRGAPLTAHQSDVSDAAYRRPIEGIRIELDSFGDAEAADIRRVIDRELSCSVPYEITTNVEEPT